MEELLREILEKMIGLDEEWLNEDEGTGSCDATDFGYYSKEMFEELIPKIQKKLLEVS